ncbi:Glycosyl transferase, family 14 [Cucumis melo var. makuwa]|nr:Glycosyl transferase, family 14 [Cucumis melo var. makuwa]TYK03791.1 Glycosyl transferase, family 14 [Cucumis melo var. makuwa]
MEDSKDFGSVVRINQMRYYPTMRILQFFLMFIVLGLGVSIISMNTFRYFGVRSAAPVVPSVSIVQPRLEEPSGNGIDSWIKTPSDLLHSMSDQELLWRASFVPQVKEYPFKRVSKIAFMFLTKGPLPMAPLWQRFFKGHEGLYSIYVHTAPSYVADFPPSSVFYRRQIPSQVAEWGEMNMCDAERRLLANALLDISNEWFILLSESCVPLHSFPTVYHYIARSRYSFVDSFDEQGPYGRGRYNRKMAPEINITDWRKGYQWFEVNRELAVKIVKDKTYYPLFKEFCRPACYVDEHYFQTMLSIESPNLLANRSLTFVDWSRGGAHPATFGKYDITEEFFKKLFESKRCLYNDQPSSLCFLFARKFAPSALDRLLEVAQKVMGF